MNQLDSPRQSSSRRKTLRSSETCNSNSRKSTLRKEIKQPKTPLVLSKEPVKSITPKQAPSHSDSQKSTPKATDLVYARIQRDLNSPSASLRIRARRALKSPGFCKATYQIFDVPHEEQDIITEEERMPYKPKTLREIFEKCWMFVDIRSGNEDRTTSIKNKLMSDGIKINDKLYKNTTHVIFKEGLQSTYNKAKKLGIPITSILWIESCKSIRCLADPEKFPISNLERYENPEIYGRIRRKKTNMPNYPKILSPPKFTAASVDVEIDEDKTITNEESLDMEVTVKEVKSDSSIEFVTQIEMKTAEKEVVKRRMTTFTPRPMEQTNCEPSQAWKSIDRRKTVFKSHFGEDRTPVAASQKSKMFNSTNRMASSSRRSALDISMRIFELNCKTMTEKSQNVEKSDMVDKETSQNITATQVGMPAVIRKRKLFSGDVLDESVEYKENCKTPNGNLSLMKKLKTDVSKTVDGKRKSKAFDRRKTISFFKARDTPDISRSVAVSKPSTKYIACTNISSADRDKAQSVIAKLGGVFEKEVSDKTTHVVTQNVERTMNLLRGIIRACYIVKFDWLTDSNDAGMFLDTTLYQHGINNNQKICERQILGKNFKNLTFSHFGPFFVSQATIDNGKKFEYVREIIQLCGGCLTSDIKSAKIVVSDMPLVVAVGLKKPAIVISTYIFDAAMQGKMIPSSKYAPKIV